MFGIFRSGKFSLYNNALNQEKNQEHFGYIDFMKITAAEDRPQQKNPPPAAAGIRIVLRGNIVTILLRKAFDRRGYDKTYSSDYNKDKYNQQDCKDNICS